MSEGFTSIYIMTSSPNVPNLYECYRLDRTDECSSLGVLIAGQDARLESKGYAATHPRRLEIQMAFAVLSSPTKRGLYDQALAADRHITWGELDYLANFGDWPDPMLLKGMNQQSPQTPQPPLPPQGYPQAYPQQNPQAYQQPQPQQQPFQQPQRPAAQSPYGQPQTQFQPNQSPYAQPFNPFQQQGYQHNVPAQFVQNNVAQQGGIQPRDYSAYLELPAVRATAGERFIMAIIDMFVGAIAVGFGAALFFWVPAGWALLSVILVALYLIGTEVKFGASPGKKMLGYEVRNRKTGEKLSAVDSAKRQWFKLVTFVPGVGTLASMVGSVWGFATINEKNSYLAVHDDIVDAEVVKKRRH